MVYFLASEVYSLANEVYFLDSEVYFLARISWPDTSKNRGILSGQIVYLTGQIREGGGLGSNRPYISGF